MLRELALRERVWERWRNVWETPCSYAALRGSSGYVFGNASGKHVAWTRLEKGLFSHDNSSHNYRYLSR
jgi:hypothetical protein